MRVRGERGAVAVEFALVLPVLLILVLGMVEFGYQLFLNGSAAGAAREGARAMAISTQSTDAVTAATTSFQATTSAGSPSVSVSPGGACAAGDPVVVTVTYTYPALTGFFGATKTAEGSGEMRCGG